MMKKLILALAFGLVIALVAIALTQRSHIKEQLITYIAEKIEAQSHCSIAIGNVDFVFPFTLHIDYVEIFKEEQLVASLDQIDISIRLLDLLYKELALKKIYIAKAFIADPTLVSEHGKDFKNLHFHNISIGLSHHIDSVELQLRLSESDAGVVAALYPLPEGYSLKFFTEIAIPKPSWERLIASYTLPEEVGGNFQIRYCTDHHQIDPMFGKDVCVKSGYLFGVIESK